VFVGNTRREEKRTSRNSKRFIFLLLNIYLLLSSQPELRKIGRQLFFDVVFARHFPQLCASTLVVTDETFFAKKKEKKISFLTKFSFYLLLLKDISKVSSRSGDGKKLDPITFTKKKELGSLPPFGFSFLQVEEKTTPERVKRRKDV